MEEDTVVRLPRPGASVTEDPLLKVLRSAGRQMLQQVIEAEEHVTELRWDKLFSVHAMTHE